MTLLDIDISVEEEDGEPLIELIFDNRRVLFSYDQGKMIWAIASQPVAPCDGNGYVTEEMTTGMVLERAQESLCNSIGNSAAGQWARFCEMWGCVTQDGIYCERWCPVPCQYWVDCRRRWQGRCETCGRDATNCEREVWEE